MTSPETPRSLQTSFRQLIDNLDLQLRFGSSEGLESACHELLSLVKMDSFEAYSETDLIGFSSNPEVVYQKLLEWKKEGVSASLIVTCGHCGEEDKSRCISSAGGRGAHHVKFLIDNFPEEL